MRIIRQALLVVGILIALGGCDQQAMFEKFVPQQEAAIAKRLLSQLAAKDYESIQKQLDPSIKSPSIQGALAQMAALFPAGEPKTTSVVGAHTSKTSGRTVYDLTFEYEYSGYWLLANVVLQRSNEQVTVLGLHVNPMQQSLKHLNRFTFEGKGILHYVVLAIAIAVPVFILYVLVLCFRAPIPKRKWLWLLFVALGFVQFSLNWTNGAFGMQPISFLLLGAGYVQAGPFAPFILKFSIPIGAIVFLAKRRSLAAQSAG